MHGKSGYIGIGSIAIAAPRELPAPDCVYFLQQSYYWDGTSI
jgi:hypothetical protein